MEHIISIAFDFDDDRVKKTAEDAVNNEMTKIVKDIVTDKIAPMSSGWYGKQDRDWSNLWNHVDSAISEMLAEHREEIIEKAADKLVKSAKSTKIWKEKFAEIMDEVDV